MPAPVNSIGGFDFVRFLSNMPLTRPTYQFSIETKPGRDGFAAIYSGRWGTPITVETESVFPTFLLAQTFKQNYQNGPQLDVVNVVQDDVSYFAQGVQFMVQNAEVKSIQAIPFYMTADAYFMPAFVVVTAWTLIPRLVP